MKCNRSYLQACTEREVPLSVLKENALKLPGKTEAEQDEMREMFTKEIEATYPLKKIPDESQAKTENECGTRKTTGLQRQSGGFLHTGIAAVITSSGPV